MLNYNDLKPGTVFILEGQPYEVLEYNFLRKQQNKPVAQTKIKNLISGKVTSYTAHSNETFNEAEINYKKVKFLYGHPDRKSSISNGTSRSKFVFSELDNPAKRFELDESQVDDVKKFLKPNNFAEAMEFEGKIINIILPIKMDFKVIEAPPGIKGDTAQGGVKAVKIETGATINVPLFIEQGDIIRINTRSGEYVERAEKTAV